jgi:hypothetical protein
MYARALAGVWATISMANASQIMHPILKCLQIGELYAILDKTHHLDMPLLLKTFTMKYNQKCIQATKKR